MADAELEEIRKARMAQLQRQAGSNGAPASREDAQAQQKKDREAEARANLLSQILLPEAADRIGRIRLVKASRAIDVENRLIMLAQSGQLRQKVTEEQLKDLLGAVADNEDKAQKITVSRSKGRWDDDDLDDLLDD